MTNYVESSGWVIFTSGSNSVKVYCENVKWMPIKNGKIKHYDGGVNVFIPVFKEYIMLTLEGIWVDSTSKIENYVKYLSSFLESGTLTTKVTYNDTPSYLELDGDNETLEMAPKSDLGEIEIIGHGNQEIYYIRRLVLEQAG